jgi:hypothetical protein
VTPRIFICILGIAAVAGPFAARAQQPSVFDLDVPPTTVVATLEIAVEPPSGAVLVYVGNSDDNAVRFAGSSSMRAIRVLSRTIRVKLIDGAKSFKVKVIGRIDALNGSKINPIAQ